WRRPRVGSIRHGNQGNALGWRWGDALGVATARHRPSDSIGTNLHRGRQNYGQPRWRRPRREILIVESRRLLIPALLDPAHAPLERADVITHAEVIHAVERLELHRTP